MGDAFDQWAERIRATRVRADQRLVDVRREVEEIDREIDRLVDRQSLISRRDALRAELEELRQRRSELARRTDELARERRRRASEALQECQRLLHAQRAVADAALVEEFVGATTEFAGMSQKKFCLSLEQSRPAEGYSAIFAKCLRETCEDALAARREGERVPALEQRQAELQGRLATLEKELRDHDVRPEVIAALRALELEAARRLKEEFLDGWLQVAKRERQWRLPFDVFAEVRG